MTKARELAELIGVSGTSEQVLAGRKNLIINGAMQVAQRGTSFTGVGNGLQYSTVDRFFSYKSNLDQLVYNSEQASDGPDGFANSFKLTVTTPETAIETSENMHVAYRTESQDMLQLKYGTSDAKSITVSFWVKSSFAGTYAFSIIANDSSRSIGGTYTVNSANTWEQKILTFSGDASGSFNDDNGIGFTLYWHLGVTTDYSSSDNTSWSSYNSTKFAYGHSANAWATTSGSTFQLTGVQLEVGSVATPFEHRSYGEELALCQRYYEKSYKQDSYAGALDNLGAFASYGNDTCNTTDRIEVGVRFSITKRAAPTIVLYDTLGGASGKVTRTNINTSSAAETGSTSEVGDTGFRIVSSSASATSSQIRCNWTADAEL